MENKYTDEEWYELSKALRHDIGSIMVIVTEFNMMSAVPGVHKEKYPNKLLEMIADEKFSEDTITGKMIRETYQVLCADLGEIPMYIKEYPRATSWRLRNGK